MIESILIALGILGSGGVFYFMNKRVNDLESKVSKAESEATAAKGYQKNAQENVEKLKEFCARIDEHLANIAKYESEAKQSGEDLTEAFGGKGEGEA